MYVDSKGRWYRCKLYKEMRIKEAIVYLLASEGCGMTTGILAEQINSELFILVL